MNRDPLLRAALIVRFLTAIALLVPSIHFAAQATSPVERFIAWTEVAGCVLFALPRIWRIGAALLLLVFAMAAVHHALLHQSPLWLIYPTMIVILVWMIDLHHSPKAS